MLRPIETERLRLRPFADDLSDVDALHAIQSDAEHMRAYGHPFSRDETTAWIRRAIAHEHEHGYALWVIEERSTGEFLGNCGPIHSHVDGTDEIEIGWSVTPRRVNQGIATESAAAVLAYCFEMLAPPRVISLVRPENPASCRVAEKIGMTVWKEVPHGTQGWNHRVYRVTPDVRRCHEAPPGS